MQVNTVNQTEFESMFGKIPETQENKTEHSGFGFENTESIFNPKPEEKKEEKPAETTSEVEETVEPEKEEKEESLFEEEKPQTELPDFGKVKGYFEEYIKEGKFLPLQDGKLETKEDIDALIEANFDHRIEEVKKEVVNSTYNRMTPAWKFVAENAEKFARPTDLIPLLQGVENIDTVASLDPEKEDEAEMIVRIALSRTNTPGEIVEEQLTTFKENKSLSKFASQYKPVLINEENKKLAEIQRRKEIEELANLEMIDRIHKNAITNLETPFLGKHKLKQEEKAQIYNLIAEPTEKSGGYKIFEAIDNLYEKNDFETLREIALILTSKESHRKYLGATIGTTVAENLLRRVKTTETASTSSESQEPEKAKLTRTNKTGLGGASGFGFFTK